MEPETIAIIIAVAGLLASGGVAFGISKATLNQNKSDIAEIKTFHRDQIEKNGQFVTFRAMKDICNDGRENCWRLQSTQMDAIKEQLAQMDTKVDALHKRFDTFLESRAEHDKNIIEALANIASRKVAA